MRFACPPNDGECKNRQGDPLFVLVLSRGGDTQSKNCHGGTDFARDRARRQNPDAPGKARENLTFAATPHRCPKTLRRHPLAAKASKDAGAKVGLASLR